MSEVVIILQCSKQLKGLFKYEKTLAKLKARVAQSVRERLPRLTWSLNLHNTQKGDTTSQEEIEELEDKVSGISLLSAARLSPNLALQIGLDECTTALRTYVTFDTVSAAHECWNRLKGGQFSRENRDSRHCAN